MSPKPVIISLAIAVVLAGVALLVYLPDLRGDDGAARPVLDIHPGEVTGLSYTSPDGQTRELIRSGADWTITWNSEGAEARSWAGDGARVRGAIRLLGDALIRGEEALDLGDATGTLRLKAGERSWELEFGTSRVGGVTPVRVQTPEGDVLIARMDRSVRDLFQPGGMLAWRSPSALPGAERGIDRAYIRSGLGAIRLARLGGAGGVGGAGGRWTMVEPITADADETRCRDLVGVLTRLSVASFEDHLEIDSDVAGLDDPGAMIALERDEGGQDDRHTLLMGIAIGLPATGDGSLLYVAIEQRRLEADGTQTTQLGPLVAQIETAQLQAITPAAEAYLSRRTLGVGVPDARRMEITRAGTGEPDVYSRSVTGWSTAGQGAIGTRDSAMLDEILTLLVSASASSVSAKAPEALREIALIELRDGQGAARGRVSIGVTEQDGRPLSLWTQAGGVYRAYPVEAHLRLVGWLQRAG